ncbi:MAG TPA: SufD family Fe-S cluster assembly protein [Rhodoferax sp.]|nr:SufD family Fe-S cluster assembly protein [Rhodoferax sp.]
MNHARAEVLTARERLASIGWIPGRSEYFRHLPPPGMEVWLGDGSEMSAADPVVHEPADAGWTLESLGTARQGLVEAQWLDAADATQRSQLFAGIAAPGDSDADRFAWAHQALCRRGLRLRIGGGKASAEGEAGETVSLALRRQAQTALEAPTLVIDVLPGMHCVLLETHERGASMDAVVQNLDVHVTLGAGASLQHLRVATPAPGDRIVHRVHARLGRGARYDQALIACGSSYHLQRTELDLHAAQGSARTGAALFAAGTALEQQVEVLHRGADTTSDVEALVLASGKARAVVNAYSRIAAGADEASVRQRLSGIPTDGQPRLVLRPHLEINHDKVQAVHGATWGALPEDALFYARQRGLNESSARALIIKGLLTALLERSLGDPDVLQTLGVDALLGNAVARYLAAGKELSHE